MISKLYKLQLHIEFGSIRLQCLTAALKTSLLYTSTCRHIQHRSHQEIDALISPYSLCIVYPSMHINAAQVIHTCASVTKQNNVALA